MTQHGSGTGARPAGRGAGPSPRDAAAAARTGGRHRRPEDLAATPPRKRPHVEAAAPPEAAAAKDAGAGAPQAEGTKGHGRGFRGDVEGLRAIAVLLVLLYHADLPGLPGGFVGVDVFFVISGFLITTQLLNELDRRGKISLVGFYARRAKRLLPAAAVVLAATAIATLTLMPKHRWTVTGGDIVSGALYVVNWRLADRSVDYLAEGIKPSPVQHYWSLAVEEQFYFVWPLLIIVAALLARRAANNRLALGLALAAVAIPSFVWSISYTSANPQRAFFVTTTRMWELAIGAGVAVAAGLLPRMGRSVAVVLGWSGVAAIVVAGVAVTAGGTAWPSWHALLPVLGAAAVIAAGPAAGPYGPAAVIGTAPFRWVGGLSYSLYLWHWPMLVIADQRWDGLSVGQGLAVVAASFVPAWLTLKLVENPVRFSTLMSRRPRLALGVGANCTAVGAAAGLALVMAVGSAKPPVLTPEQVMTLGANELAAESPAQKAKAVVVDYVPKIIPDPAVADRDVPDVYELGCQVNQQSATPVSCSFGPAQATTTIAVVGDSKAVQWLPALQALANANNWRVITYTKSGCPLAQGVEVMLADGTLYDSCRAWNDQVMERLTGAEKPDFVLTSQLATNAIGPKGEKSRSAMRGALTRTWGSLTDAGIRVLVLADNPHPSMEVWQCASEHPKKLSKCAFDRASGVKASAAVVQREAVTALGGRVLDLANRASRADERPALGTAPAPVYLDLVDSICYDAVCPPVIGSVLVYRQGSHLTATYVTTLAPRLEEALKAAGVPSERKAGAPLQAAPAASVRVPSETGVTASGSVPAKDKPTTAATKPAQGSGAAPADRTAEASSDKGTTAGEKPASTPAKPTKPGAGEPAKPSSGSKPKPKPADPAPAKPAEPEEPPAEPAQPVDPGPAPEPTAPPAGPTNPLDGILKPKPPGT